MIAKWVLIAMALLGIAISFPASAEVRVFACEPEWAALAREVGRGHVKAFSATSKRQDPHHIRAKPSLIAAMRRADLLFCSGAGLEVGWLPILLRQSAKANVQPGKPGHFLAADYVKVLEIPAVIDRSLGDVHPEGNPHVHLDARNMIPLALELSRRLAAVDPPNGQAYAEQADAFVDNWSEHLTGWQGRALKLNGLPVIVHHKSWAYLIDWLGLTQLATLEPRPGIQPTPGHLSRLLRSSRLRPAKAILRTPYDPPEASDWLSSKTSTPVLELRYTVEKTGSEGRLKALFDDMIAQLETVTTVVDGDQ